METSTAGTALVDKVLEVGVQGFGPIKGARETAEDHLKQHGDVEKAIDRLVATHGRVVGATGFVTGLGGLVTLPLAVPTDVAALYVYQGRMAAGIAHLRGYDLDSDEVRSVVLLSLLGASGAEVLSKVGIEVANKSALAAVRKIPGKVFIEINKKVGFRLITKAGTKGTINVVKIVPVAGGVAGGAVNVAATRTVAKYARKNFPSTQQLG